MRQLGEPVYTASVAEASETTSAALPSGFGEAACSRLPPALVAVLGEITEGPLASLPSLRIILFGSRATGRGGPRSDFDLGFDAAGPLDPRVTTEIRERIDNLPIFQTVDVVDLSQVSAEFRAVAESEAVALYERRA
jgi:predicted nucleotidyltransferase